jgi:hypothetical protein
MRVFIYDSHSIFPLDLLRFPMYSDTTWRSLADEIELNYSLRFDYAN